jgi:D-arabinonate dehydratase
MTGIIRKVEAFECILPLPKPLKLGEATIPHREYVFVRVHDEDGNFGTGFALTRNAPVALSVLRNVAPFWEGKSFDEYETFYERTVRANAPLGTNGIFWRALSLTDCALHDLLAQRAGKPLAEYLGKTLQATPTMLVGGYPSPDETFENLKDQMKTFAGFLPNGVKIGSSSNYSQDTLRLKACREALPESIPLMIDLYWNAKNAASLLPEAKKWGEFNMGWIEDPFLFDDFENVSELATHLPYPVAVGDEQSGIRHFTKLMDVGRIGVVRLDATVCGGVQAFLKIAALAAERNLWVSCHVYHHLHVQLASVIPNGRWLEYFLPSFGLDSIQLVWNSDLDWKDGALVPPQKNGMGYDWNEDALKHYRKDK